MNHNYRQSSPYDDGNTICLANISIQKQIAATRDRTRDLQIFSLTLSQLSYRGLFYFSTCNKLMTITRRSSPYDDRHTTCLVNISKQQTNCPDPGSNQGPSDLQSDALPTELSRHMFRLLTNESRPAKQPIRRKHDLFSKHINTETNCRDPGSNQGPSDLQSDALPTELSWHILRLLTNESQLPDKSSPYDDGNTICLVNISKHRQIAATRDRTRDLQIFSLTLSQLSYRGTCFNL